MSAATMKVRAGSLAAGKSAKAIDRPSVGGQAARAVGGVPAAAKGGGRADPLGFLTPDEMSELRFLEAKVAEGLKAYEEAGRALGKIRDKRLYRASHGTWTRYARARWGMTMRYADKIIACAAVSAAIRKKTPAGFPVPRNYAQANELSRLSTTDAVSVWTKVAKAEGKVTASLISKEIAERGLSNRCASPELKFFTVSMNLSAKTHASLHLWAAERGLTLSGAVRDIVTEFLASESANVVADRVVRRRKHV